MLSANISDDEMLPPSSSSNQRKSLKTASQTNTNEILKAYQVTAYKYVDSKYENRGKIGLALLGTKTAGTFNILLYGKANIVLTQVTITKDFEVTSGRDLYISFYDVKSENWSILFDSIDTYSDFLNRVSILKLVSSKQEYIYLDVRVGEGISVHDSDLCEAEILINGVKNCEIVSTLYSSESQEATKIIRLKIGSNKLLPAVDKGISGMMKGGQRIIAISSSSALLKGGSIKIPNDTSALLNIKVIRIKTKTEKPSLNNESGDSELSLPNLNFNRDADNDVADQSKKMDLLNRMKRMGQPIVKPNVSDENEQGTSKTSDQSSYVQSSQTFVPRPQPVSNISMFDNMSYNNQMMPLHSNNQIMSAMQHIYQPLPTPIQTASTDTNLVFTETRQHNTEMRIAISKLQDKVDRISEKIDNTNFVQKQPVVRHMDAENVFENIKRIIDENELLKRECSQKSDTIDSQNKRINELLNKSQQYLEESRNVMERSSVTFTNTDSESQRKILKLEEEKLDLIRNLSKKTSELSNLEIKVESLNGESQGYRNKSLEFNEQLDKLTSELGNLKLKNRSLLTEIDKMKEERLTVMGTNEDLIEWKRQAVENERKMQHNIDTLKNTVRESNGNIEQIRKECDNEIMEIRQQCNVEIEQLREKLKQERRMTTSKSSNLETELETVNKEWESKLNDLKQAEVSKLMKLNERNSQLMSENSSLNQEIFELKDELTVLNNNHSSKLEELNSNNRLLKRQLDDTHAKAQEVDRLRIDNDNHEREMARLTKVVRDMDRVKEDLQTTIERKRELESMVKTLSEELNVKSSLSEKKVDGSNSDVEAQIKSIMNDIFKKIKSEFELEKSYNGKEVNGKCMVIIRDSTVNLMKSQTGDVESSDEDISDSDNSGDESIGHEDNTEELITKQNDERNLSPAIDLDTDGDCIKNNEEYFVNKKIDFESFVKYGTEAVVEHDGHDEVLNDAPFSDILEKEEIMESEYSKEIPNDGHYVEIQEKDEIVESEDSKEILYNENFNEINYEEEMVVQKEVDMQCNSGNIEIKIEDNYDPSANINIETTITETEEISKEEFRMDLSHSLHDDVIPEMLHQSTEIVSNDLEPKSESELKSSEEKVKEKNSLFSSDEEDEDVSGFFEQLNQKKKAKVEQTKPVTSSDMDDELSWLHS